jgi:hypothetical protein
MLDISNWQYKASTCLRKTYLLDTFGLATYKQPTVI